MFIHYFGIEDKLLNIIGSDFSVVEQHIAAHIWKEKYGEAQICIGEMELCQSSQSGTEQKIAAQSSDRHQVESQIKMERYRQHGAVSDMNGAAQAEKSGTDIGIVGTCIIDQDGVVWDGINCVHRGSKGGKG